MKTHTDADEGTGLAGVFLVGLILVLIKMAKPFLFILLPSVISWIMPNSVVLSNRNYQTIPNCHRIHDILRKANERQNVLERTKATP